MHTIHSLNSRGARALFCGISFALTASFAGAQSESRSTKGGAGRASELPSLSGEGGGGLAREEPASTAMLEEEGSVVSRAYFQRGLSYAGEGEYLKAQGQFQKALEEEPPLEAFFGLGQVELALGHPCRAQEAYAQYLKRGAGRVSKKKRRRVEQHMRQLTESGALSIAACAPEEQPGFLKIACGAHGAEVRLDGRKLNLRDEGPLSLSVGEHRVEFYEGDRRWSSALVQLKPGEVALVQCSVPLLAERQEEGRMSTRKKAAWALTGTGLGFFTATLSHYFWNKGRYDAWKEELEVLQAQGGTPEQEQRHRDIADSINSASAVTVGLAIASGALTAGGLALFYIDGKEEKKASAVSVPRTSLSTEFSSQSAFVSWRGVW